MHSIYPLLYIGSYGMHTRKSPSAPEEQYMYSNELTEDKALERGNAHEDTAD